MPNRSPVIEPMTQAWGQHVDESFAKLWDQNDRQETRLAENAASMDEIKSQLKMLTDFASPAIDAKEQFQRGLHAIGVFGAVCNRVAAFVSRWVRRVVKIGLTVLAAWGFYKAVLSGHSLADAWEIASKVLK